jgi:hypothetical protein
MTRKILVTFGCSWMYGVGVHYVDGMLLDEYRSDAWNRSINDEHSFRGILSKKYNIQNINFSIGGSSNQHQFLRLKKFFNSDRYKDLVKKNAEIVVLHGITSTARSYFYEVKDEVAKDIMFNDNSDSGIKNYILNFYNHEHEIQLLTEEIQFINQFYKSNGIKNLWFDTFNTHKYNSELDNFLGHNDVETRDLLSQMALQTGIEDMDRKYHRSTWKVDSNRIVFLVKSKHLNPVSHHPTKLGHQLIADIISPELEKIL